MPSVTSREAKLEPKGTADEICEAVCRSFDRSFGRCGVNRKTVTSAFEAALEGLRKAKDPESKIRAVAKSAALSTGRQHGNVVETGRWLLDQIEVWATRYSLQSERAKNQLLLGLADGACQLGPVVYCRFLDVACSYKENADDWIVKQRRRPLPVPKVKHPVIVPYLDELTLRSPQPSPTRPTASLPDQQQWSRPKKERGFFRRLSDAVGYWFGSE